MRAKRTWTLYAFFFVNFLTSFSTLASKYYVEIGMTESQIGMLTSLPSLVAMCFMPVWGTYSDRVRYKRTIICISALGAGIAAFFVNSFVSFLPLLAALTVYSVFSQPTIPTSTAIALEHTASIGKKFGPIRMTGSLGYQAGLLLGGFIFAASLKGLYAAVGVVSIAAAAIALLLPPVEGHQHSKAKKVPMTALFKNPRIRWLFAIIFIGEITVMFYNSFFTAHLGQIGMSNSLTAFISLLSVLLEVPMLFFADRFAKKLSVWNWMLVFFVLTGLRWVGLAFTENPVLIVLFQIPAFTVPVLLEFIPQQYLSRAAGSELTGAAQSAHSLVAYGAARVVGSLLGGYVGEWIGLPAMFCCNGILLIVAAAILLIPCRRLTLKDKADGVA